jgi:hypothetical protein
MLVAYRLAGLSALEGHYAGFNARTQFGATQRSSNKPMQQWRKQRSDEHSAVRGGTAVGAG